MPIPSDARDDEPMTTREVADFLGITTMSVWRAVNEERLPKPFYPAARAPRWTRGEVREARERLRMLPSEAKAGTRAAKLRARAATAGKHPQAAE